MEREDNVQRGPAAFIGMSNGAIASMAMQLRRPIAGVVSLDGGIGEDAGGAYLKERSGGDVPRLRAPLLHLYTEPNPYLNLSHVRGYEAAARTLVRVDGMRHVDFLNDAMFDHFLTSDARAQHAAEGFRAVCEYALSFLRAMTSPDPAPAAWLPLATRGFIRVEHHAPLAPRPQ